MADEGEDYRCIPNALRQSGNTCWFDASLTGLMFSDYMRRYTWPKCFDLSYDPEKGRHVPIGIKQDIEDVRIRIVLLMIQSIIINDIYGIDDHVNQTTKLYCTLGEPGYHWHIISYFKDHVLADLSAHFEHKTIYSDSMITVDQYAFAVVNISHRTMDLHHSVTIYYCNGELKLNDNERDEIILRENLLKDPGYRAIEAVINIHYPEAIMTDLELYRFVGEPDKPPIKPTPFKPIAQIVRDIATQIAALEAQIVAVDALSAELEGLDVV